MADAASGDAAGGVAPAVPTTALSARTLRRLLLAALTLGVVVLVVVAAFTVWLVARDQDYTTWVNHTYIVERHVSQLSGDFEEAEAARRGYLLTRNPEYLAVYRGPATDMPRMLEQLRALTADNPRERANLDRLEPMIARKLGALEASMRAAETSDAAIASRDVEQDQGLVSAIRGLIEDMRGEENRLLAIRSERQESNTQLLLTVVLATFALLALLAIGAMLIVRRYADDLDRSQTALRRLNEGLEQVVRARTADLTRANEEIQRFAYIVSHDLRSPLVNVMGFTSEFEAALVPLHGLIASVEQKAPEALTPAVKQAVEEDLPEAIRFIRSSTQKMDRLINAILRLSREGRRTFTVERLDMTTLIEGVLATLKHSADERGAEVTIEAPLPDLVNDRLAVEQVFANLVENALKYLKPGRPGRVTVRGREDGDRRVYEVEDNGRGVDPKDHERIFELFRRAGAQDQPGEGIGLAHVRALVYRLGGTVTVESDLDRGATFRLSLPRNPVREEGPRA